MNKKTFLANNISNKSENLDWSSVQSQMKEKFGKDIYESWLKKLSFVEELNNYVLLSVSTRFIRDWITSRYLDEILKLIKINNKNISRIELKVDDNKNFYETDKNVIDDQLKKNISFIKDSFLQYNRIDQNKKFENFVVGDSNKLAFEASKKVTENFSHYNPLYVYGGVGMGKTHLINSIGLVLKENYKVMFISAERFMYQFIKSIKSNEMVKFKEYFRNSDVFIMDDIQFMNGKEAMQEEFFHTFNSLIEKGSQIIISADRPPNKLVKIQERIKSRFSGGLVIDIQKPDTELRKKILQFKFEEFDVLYPNEQKLTTEVLNFLSNEIKTNVRELVGAFNRIISFSRIYNKCPSIPEVKIILKDLLDLTTNKITVEMIQSIVCRYFKISKNEMLSSRRSRYLVRPRQSAIYLTKILTSKSLPEIGRDFANRDHTTVIHSVKTIERLKNEDLEFSKSLDNIKNQILYNKNNEV